ncbi:nucleotidyltransferase domain-containing protein [Clostridium oryzae]|uniref:Nucleotidyltransferase domain protein n=1 Tax=Clostridium oryzae TaxID=1450648 RepID=A0A1V4IBG9_9CLOT|nr:nucleotidyltransferase domain-containing protein [Clostridium oryzae]OPJ57341.1 nucleotidyltransferase domain protein [Clostridium oryzae]
MDTIISNSEITKIVEKYAQLLSKELKINSIYLYGSYAKGTFSNDSDIDIAVIGEDFIGDPVEDTLKLMRIRRKVDNRIEPHPFRVKDFDTSDPYVQEILNTGIKIM